MGLIHFSPLLHVAFHTETSHQMTGFYMEFNTVLKWVKVKNKKTKVTSVRLKFLWWTCDMQSMNTFRVNFTISFVNQLISFNMVANLALNQLLKCFYCWIESCFCVLGMSGRDKSLRFYMEAILIQKEVKRNKNGLRKIFKYLNSFPP